MFAGAKRLFTRDKALRRSAGEVRRKSAIHGQTTKMSLQPSNGSQRFFISSTTASRNLAASSAQQKITTKRRRRDRGPGAQGRRITVVDARLANRTRGVSTTQAFETHKPRTNGRWRLGLTKRARVRHLTRTGTETYHKQEKFTTERRQKLVI